MTRRGFERLTAEVGQVVEGMVKVPRVDPAWYLPTIVVRGEQDGPTLAVTAGIHAGEYAPVEALTRWSRQLKPKRLRGTLVAVLVVNTPGFMEHSVYGNPRDGKDIAHVFPGSDDGSPAERVGAFLFQELILRADSYIDMHSGDIVEDLIPFTMWPKVVGNAASKRSAALAHAYGLGRCIGLRPEAVVGTPDGEAVQRGVPAMTAEAGQQGMCEESAVSYHLRGLGRVMEHMGMTASRTHLHMDRDEVEYSGFSTSRTVVSGTWHPAVAVGEVVRQGQRVGELHNLFGEKVDDVYARDDGEVIFLVKALAVRAGDPLLGVGIAP